MKKITVLVILGGVAAGGCGERPAENPPGVKIGAFNGGSVGKLCDNGRAVYVGRGTSGTLSVAVAADAPECAEPSS